MKKMSFKIKYIKKNNNNYVKTLCKYQFGNI